jgi:hypothetical protein
MTPSAMDGAAPIAAPSWSECPQTIFSGQMRLLARSKTSRTVETMIHKDACGDEGIESRIAGHGDRRQPAPRIRTCHRCECRPAGSPLWCGSFVEGKSSGGFNCKKSPNGLVGTQSPARSLGFVCSGKPGSVSPSLHCRVAPSPWARPSNLWLFLTPMCSPVRQKAPTSFIILLNRCA